MASVSESFENSLGIKFVLVKAQSFMMGDKDGQPSEQPVHKVTITKPFYISIYPVAHQLYSAFSMQRQTLVLGALTRSVSSEEARKKPAVSMIWDEAYHFAQYVARRDQRAGLLPQGAQYRLPTEAEWECACRAGTSTKFSFGDTIAKEQANFLGSDLRAVDTGAPNPWGLSDMHGNAAEFCMDYFSDKYYAESPEKDPTGPEKGDAKVIRGGSYSEPAQNCRSAARASVPIDARRNYVGFRLVRTIP
ncbi:MAG TPA: formylglycine-generating enzyme family protein [Planctomycetota bacterium]|nr:formylglycine-generating enzyme family protein [Planctomycetota bacterium]